MVKFFFILLFDELITMIREPPSWYALCHGISVFVEVKVVSPDLN